MLQSLTQWAAMGGYGGYVWSVLGLLLLLLAYEVCRLRAMQRRLAKVLPPREQEENAHEA